MPSSEDTLRPQGQPMIEETASPDAPPVYAADQLPTAFLPSYSVGSPYKWEEEAKIVFRNSLNFCDITLTIKFIPLSDPTIPTSLLSGRQKDWLDAFLIFLCQDKAINVPTCDSPLSTAETIVAIISWRPLIATRQLTSDWLFLALYDSEISTIAERLDIQIHSVFCTITYADWIAWCRGYRKDIVVNFLDALLSCRNRLVQLAQQDVTLAEKLVSLQKALPSQQPLIQWVVSTAVSFDTSSNPSDALRHFLDPITQQFTEENPSISAVCQRLSILNTRFDLKVIRATQPEWPMPFSINFAVWEFIQVHTPQELAGFCTSYVSGLFQEISIADLLSDNGRMADIGRIWSESFDEFLACLNVHKQWSYFIYVADDLIRRRNIFSAAAVGLALSQAGYRPRNPPPVWYIINPQDNFAGCREFMASNPACLPYMFPHIKELRESGNAPGKILEVYEMIVGYLKIEREAKLGQSKNVGQKRIGKGMIDFKSLPYEKNFPWALKQLRVNIMQCFDGVTSRISSNSTSGREMTEHFPSFQKLPIEIRYLIWEKALPKLRVFDHDTIRSLGPSDLIPWLVQACHDSRTFAQSRLRCTILRGRTIYFNPEYDIYRFRSPDLLWRHEMFFAQCLFSCIEIFATVGPEQLSNALGTALRSTAFHKQFPHLTKLILTDQQTSLRGDGPWNKCSEERWMNQHKDDQEWRLVQEFLESRNISVRISPVVPETYGTQITNTWRNDHHTNLGISPQTASLLSAPESLSLLAKPSAKTSQAISEAPQSQYFDSSTVVYDEQKALTPDPEITPGPAYFEYWRADGSRVQYTRSFTSGEESFADSESTKVLSESKVNIMVEENFLEMNGIQNQLIQDSQAASLPLSTPLFPILSSSSRDFICDWQGCGRDYESKRTLTRHRKTHTGDKSQICSFRGCGKSFIRKRDLNNHSGIHSGKEAYECEYIGCGKVLLTNLALIQHRSIHTAKASSPLEPATYVSSDAAGQRSYIHEYVPQNTRWLDLAETSRPDSGHAFSLSQHSNWRDVVLHTGQTSSQVNSTPKPLNNSLQADRPNCLGQKSDPTNDYIQCLQNLYVLNQTRIKKEESAEFVRRFSSSEQSVADTEATQAFSGSEVIKMMHRNFPATNATHATKIHDRSPPQEAAESYYSQNQGPGAWDEEPSQAAKIARWSAAVVQALEGPRLSTINGPAFKNTHGRRKER